MNIATAPTQGTNTTTDYRYDHPQLSVILNDMLITKNDLGPGDKLMPFELQMIDGSHLRSTDLPAQGKPVLLVFGSLTCPVTESAADGLTELYATYGKKIRFIMINVREAHPADLIPQPRTLEQKILNAIALKKHHKLPFEVAVDDLDGTLHRTLGSRPNSAYVIDTTGTITFRAQWANETQSIGEALDAIIEGKAPPKPSISRTIQALAKALGYGNRVFSAAGKGAYVDTWKAVPPMGMMVALSELFFFLPLDKRGMPAMLLTMGLMVAAALGIVALIARFIF